MLVRAGDIKKWWSQLLSLSINDCHQSLDVIIFKKLSIKQSIF